MKLVTAQQMRAIDRATIDGFGVPALELMESAGKGIAEFAREILGGNVSGKRIAIFCGKGNNGGDGYVVARYLNNWGAIPDIYLLADRSTIEGDALVNLRKIQEIGLKIVDLSTKTEMPDFAGSQLIVDAMFGTGFKGQLESKVAGVIAKINASGIPVLAIDTPSGLNNDTGEIAQICVKATFTASLALPKLGQSFYPGKSYCGKTKVIDIGIPQHVVDAQNLFFDQLTFEEVRRLIPDRLPTAHKGDCGKIFIVAGSTGLTGAAALCATAAVKSGSGLVTVGCPKGLNDILEIKLTEAMTKPLPEIKNRRCLATRSLGTILENIAPADALCLGPGVGRHYETIELFRRLIGRITKPAVLDADGLFAFSGKPELLRECKADLVLTPHPGEFSRLSGLEAEEIAADPIGCASRFAEHIGKVVLLKGAPTVIASPAGQAYVNPTGNEGMATGGSGDVLSGVIGALLGFGMSALDAAACGVYIHGQAGDLARNSLGTFGMTAGDIAEQLPAVFKSLKN